MGFIPVNNEFSIFSQIESYDVVRFMLNEKKIKTTLKEELSKIKYIIPRTIYSDLSSIRKEQDTHDHINIVANTLNYIYTDFCYNLAKSIHTNIPYIVNNVE